MKKQKYGLFNDQERKQMNLPALKKPEDSFSLFSDEERAEAGMAPRAKFEDNFSLEKESKPNRFKELLGKLSATGNKMASAGDVEATPTQAQKEIPIFKPEEVKAAEFGNVNVIKPAEFDYENKLMILRKLMGE